MSLRDNYHVISVGSRPIPFVIEMQREITINEWIIASNVILVWWVPWHALSLWSLHISWVGLPSRRKGWSWSHLRGGIMWCYSHMMMREEVMWSWSWLGEVMWSWSWLGVVIVSHLWCNQLLLHPTHQFTFKILSLGIVNKDIRTLNFR